MSRISVYYKSTSKQELFLYWFFHKNREKELKISARKKINEFNFYLYKSYFISFYSLDYHNQFSCRSLL